MCVYGIYCVCECEWRLVWLSSVKSTLGNLPNMDRLFIPNVVKLAHVMRNSSSGISLNPVGVVLIQSHRDIVYLLTSTQFVWC